MNAKYTYATEVSVVLLVSCNKSCFLVRKCKQKRNANVDGLQTCSPITLPYGQPFLFFSERELKNEELQDLYSTASHSLHKK